MIEIVSLPANTPNTPNIGIIMLSTENLTSETATQYRGLRQWSFSKIKAKYEDIGDFFDDALKPLRLKLREETKALALREAAVFQNFLKLACPSNPQVAEQVMNHVRAKVNPRFEGGAVYRIRKSSHHPQFGGFSLREGLFSGNPGRGRTMTGEITIFGKPG